MHNKGIEVPFKHTLWILGPQGKVIRVLAVFDGAAMVAAMCKSIFEKVKHRLGAWNESKKLLKMANGVIIPSLAVWKGKMQLGEMEIEGEFEVFDSKGGWAFLLEKLLLQQFGTRQEFSLDTVTMGAVEGSRNTILHNEIMQLRQGDDIVEVNLTLDVKQKEQDPDLISTRGMNPWNPKQVARILKEVTFGKDIKEGERNMAQAVVAEFADCFALSIKEVNTVPGAVHKLKIPEGVTFRTKILLRLYNPDQKAFIEAKVDEMLEARIICSIHPRDVWFVAQTVLSQKVHEGDGLTLDELKH